VLKCATLLWVGVSVLFFQIIGYGNYDRRHELEICGIPLKRLVDRCSIQRQESSAMNAVMREMEKKNTTGVELKLRKRKKNEIKKKNGAEMRTHARKRRAGWDSTSL